ncbi:MAG TPA: type I pullulanase [Chitinophagales bacterium]|nr:type I pullulanase [Chitinophagales bacterium]HRK26247.1 type I pullulanase [Chitinophagales bacterium]
MKYTPHLIVLIISIMLSACTSQRKTEKPAELPANFDLYPFYGGKDLGLTYSTKQSVFKIWAPNATQVKLKLYDAGINGNLLKEAVMAKSGNGTWAVTLDGNQKGKFYTFQVLHQGKWLTEVPDPYAKAVGVNGLRAMVVDLKSTNPKDWDKDKRPPLKSFADILIYEIHLRDISVSPTSGIKNKGKYLGLTEKGTTSPQGEKTGLDHIAQLGVTHAHILPCFDHNSIDETRLNEPQYNWGYDPLNYNAPEGSYATDPYDGSVRIREFKEMVKALHNAGIRVIMDVVYNHTGLTQDSYFEQLVPGYYYRQRADGSFSDASACGNETASERAMVRKFIVESVKYWATEYHIDGFRFDLMAIHDIETMNQVRAALDEIDPTIFVYGEGWTPGNSPLPEDKRPVKKSIYKLPRIAAFSDDLRDGLKGSVFIHEEKGFVSGASGKEETIKFGIVAATQHPQIDYSKINYSTAYWAGAPIQCINYVSCHDNHTLYDRLRISNAADTEEKRLLMHRLANTIVLTSQGIPFLHAGEEMTRTKNGEENSYKSPDAINQIDWLRKSEHKNLFEYHVALIALRKAHPAFRMTTTEQLLQHLEFLPIQEPNVVGYLLKNNANGDSWKNILVLFNGNQDKEVTIKLPDGNWKTVVDDWTVDLKAKKKYKDKKAELSPISALILADD